MRPRLFPLGTSRLHWALEYLARADAAEVTFPGFGYFQAAHQIADVAEWLHGAALRAPAGLVFRRDATPSNPFDLDAFLATDGFAEPRREDFQEADVVLVEISTLVTFFLGSTAVQGNPNVDREVPFKEVWQTGYYAKYAPALPVVRQEVSAEALSDACARIDRAIGNRPVICFSHIFSSDGPDHGRAAVAALVGGAARGQGWTVLETSSFVDRYGFRRRADGHTDIHHLSWPGTAAFAATLLSEACQLMGGTPDHDLLCAVREDRWQGRIA